MDKAVLEQEAKKLFGGATITVSPYQDAIMSAWDVTVVPYIDKGVRFVRVKAVEGMPGAIAYLKKIQENLLKLNHNGAFGINPVPEKIDQAKIEEEIAKKLPKNRETYACLKCGKTFKYPGIYAIHMKRHVDRPQSISSAPNEKDIYDAK